MNNIRNSMLIIILLSLWSIDITPARRVEATQLNTITYISSLAWSPDGSLIAVGKGSDEACEDSDPYTIEILDAISLRVVQKLAGNHCEITAMDWSADGTKLASASLDGDGPRIWDVKSGELIMPAQSGGHGNTSVRWHPDGHLIVVSGVGNGTALIDVLTGKVIGNAVIGGTSLDWNPDGSKLVSGSIYENDIYVADMVNKLQIIALEGHTDTISAVDWSPDGSKIASASMDETMRLWDANTGTPLLVINASIQDLRWSPNSQYLATISNNDDTGNGTVEIWNATKGTILYSFPYQSRIYAVDWSPNGKQLVYGGVGVDGKAAEVQIVDVDQLQMTPLAEVTP